VCRMSRTHACVTCHARTRMSHVTRVCYTSQAHAASAAGFTCVALTGRVLYESRLLHMSNTVTCVHMSNAVQPHKGRMSHRIVPLSLCTGVPAHESRYVNW